MAAATALATAGLALTPVSGAAEDVEPADPAACTLAPAPLRGTGEGPARRGFVRPEGHRRAAMVMVDFSDLPAVTPAAERAAFFSRYGDAYLKRASYGTYRLTLTPTRTWIRMPRPWSAYGIARGAPVERMRRYVRDALRAAAAEGTRPADADLVYVVADSNVPAAPTVSQAHTFRTLRVGRARVHGAALIFGRAGDSPLWQRGNFVHEANHLYGLPDLYNVRRGATVEYAGGWDTMSMAGISDLMGWHKAKLGWIPPHRVDCVVAPGTTEHVLTPIGAPGARLAVVRTGRYTALVAEARTRTGLDRGLCTEGVLLYSVSSRVPSGLGPVRVVDSRPRSLGGPSCADRLPAELAELSDAPFRPGEGHTFDNGVRMEVTRAADGAFGLRVRVPDRDPPDTAQGPQGPSPGARSRPGRARGRTAAQSGCRRTQWPSPRG
nr:peptidase M6 [Streptomyces boncukensis]